jgi:alginate O-acetyltransferase complex protein AlgI
MAAMILRPHVDNWIFMWGVAVGLYAGCKWQTYQAAKRLIPKTGWRRAAGYLLAYPGMNAREFLDHNEGSGRPRPTEWLCGAIKILAGIILLYGVTPRVFPANPLLAGWTGMLGLILILHFGLFHWLVLAWQCAGVKATPLMLSPLRATSLAEFWGRRWNTGFKELSWQLMFRPLRRRTGAATATLLVFGASGLIHELVISLPARGGYGLPTLYFLLQGAGLMAERTSFARHLGLGRGWRGWFFTIFLTAAPVFWLFHPPFIEHVILPMLHVFGATGKPT